MKTKSIVIIALLAFLPLAGFSQPPNPPTPPNPPISPVPPIPPDKPERMPKVPVTFLGVETSAVPSVVCDQLGIAKGFGLVVDYVVPDGPAAAAGVQQNDSLKMLNDQILLEPGQLAKLVRSYSEGTTVTLTVLRKGQEQKISVKLTKKEVPKRHASRMGHDMDFNFNYDLGDFDLGNLKERLDDLREDMKDQFGEHGDMVHDAVMTAEGQAQRIRDEAQRARDRAQHVRDEAQRARYEAHRVRDESRKDGQIKVTRTGDNGLMTTKIDIGKAQIVFSDDKGELRLERPTENKILTQKIRRACSCSADQWKQKKSATKFPRKCARGS